MSSFVKSTNETCHRCGAKAVQNSATIPVHHEDRQEFQGIDSYEELCERRRELAKTNPWGAASAVLFRWECLECGANGS